MTELIVLWAAIAAVALWSGWGEDRLEVWADECEREARAEEWRAEVIERQHGERW